VSSSRFVSPAARPPVIRRAADRVESLERQLLRAGWEALIVALVVLTVGVMAARPGGHAEVALDTTHAAADRPAPERRAGARPTTSASRYTVRPGDTLRGIARLFGADVDAIAAANRLDPDGALRPGTALAIPSAGTDLGALPDLARADMTRRALVPTFERWATVYGVPADLLESVAWVESRWDNSRVSEAGAVGIGQLLPSTAAWLGDRVLRSDVDLADPGGNIQASAAFLRWLLDLTGGDEAAALAAYHQGHRSVSRSGWAPVTERYVRDVMTLRPGFRALAT
jgi:soluble lytic murein transglycosylase-like protein